MVVEPEVIGVQEQKSAHQNLDDLSPLYNPVIRGWIQYFGRSAPVVALWCDNWTMNWSSGPDRNTRKSADTSGARDGVVRGVASQPGTVRSRALFRSGSIMGGRMT